HLAAVPQRTSEILRGRSFPTTASDHRFSTSRKAVSLPCGTSAFARKRDTRRVNRMVIEGASPSIRLRARFPLPPSRSAMDGVSIEVEDELELAFVSIGGVIRGGNRRRALELGPYCGSDCR